MVVKMARTFDPFASDNTLLMLCFIDLMPKKQLPSTEVNLILNLKVTNVKRRLFLTKICAKRHYGVDLLSDD